MPSGMSMDSESHPFPALQVPLLVFLHRAAYRYSIAADATPSPRRLLGCVAFLHVKSDRLPDEDTAPKNHPFRLGRAAISSYAETLLPTLHRPLCVPASSDDDSDPQYNDESLR